MTTARRCPGFSVASCPAKVGPNVRHVDPLPGGEGHRLVRRLILASDVEGDDRRHTVDSQAVEDGCDDHEGNGEGACATSGSRPQPWHGLRRQCSTSDRLPGFAIVLWTNRV